MNTLWRLKELILIGTHYFRSIEINRWPCDFVPNGRQRLQRCVSTFFSGRLVERHLNPTSFLQDTSVLMNSISRAGVVFEGDARLTAICLAKGMLAFEGWRVRDLATWQSNARKIDPMSSNAVRHLEALFQRQWLPGHPPIDDVFFEAERWARENGLVN